MVAREENHAYRAILFIISRRAHASCASHWSRHK